MSVQHVRFCTSFDGAKLAYAVAGHGPPLVLLPSWLTHLDYQWRSVAWRPWLEALSSRYTLIRYDPRGCGLSDRNVPGGPPPCYAEPKIRNVVARYGWETDNA